MFPGLGRLNLKGFYVEWNDITDVWLYWDDMKSRIIRNVGERIGFSSGTMTITVLLKLLKTVFIIRHVRVVAPLHKLKPP